MLKQLNNCAPQTLATKIGQTRKKLSLAYFSTEGTPEWWNVFWPGFSHTRESPQLGIQGNDLRMPFGDREKAIRQHQEDLSSNPTCERLMNTREAQTGGAELCRRRRQPLARCVCWGAKGVCLTRAQPKLPWDRSQAPLPWTNEADPTLVNIGTG